MTLHSFLFSWSNQNWYFVPNNPLLSWSGWIKWRNPQTLRRKLAEVIFLSNEVLYLCFVGKNKIYLNSSTIVEYFLFTPYFPFLSLTGCSHLVFCRKPWWLHILACVRPSRLAGKSGRNNEQICTGHTSGACLVCGNNCGKYAPPDCEKREATWKGHIQ